MQIRRLINSALFVCVGAAPGFVLGNGISIFGRVCGLCFWIAIGYWICSTDRFQRHWRDPSFAAAVRATVAMRCLQSIFPMCWFPELAGACSIVNIARIMEREISSGADGSFQVGLLLSVGYGLGMMVSSGAILFVAWGQFWARGIRAEFRGNCLVCGYDLRASPERCPECGTLRPEAAQ